MTVEFKKEVVRTKFLDPAKEFSEGGFDFEVRADPLTGRLSYVYQLNYGGLPQPRDIAKLVQKSLERKCPFCPDSVEETTPQFVSELFPEGRLRRGEALLFPNAIPYAPYSALCIPSGQHYISLLEFNETILTDAFMIGQTYLKRVQEYDEGAKYSFIGWNYMPFSGGSQLHPHLHIQASHFATPQQKELIEAAKKYLLTNGTNFWFDLLNEEQKLGERYIGRVGGTCWLASFAPRGRVFDILAIFPGRDSLTAVTEQEFKEFSQGLIRVFRYMNDGGFYSFNLTVISGITGDDCLWTQARIIPRMVFSALDVSDCTYLQLLHDIHFVSKYPEDVCREIGAYFNG